MAEQTNNVQQTLQDIRKQYDTTAQKDQVNKDYDAKVAAINGPKAASARNATNVQRNAELNKIAEQDKKNEPLIRGAEFGATILGEGLGRLSSDEDIKGVLSRYKDQSQGLDAAEMQADRERAYQGISQSTQTASRQVQAAMARAGVRGGVAGAQLRDVAIGGMQQKAEVERDLFLKNADAKRTGLENYASALGEVKTFDLGQAAKEKDIILQSAMGVSGQQVALDSARMQAESARASLAAQQRANSCFAPDTEILMIDGSYKEIQDVRLGDETAWGVVKGITKHLISGEDLMLYGSTCVTPMHPVLTRNGWSMVQDTRLAKNAGFRGEAVVYDLMVEKHRIETKDAIFADYDGYDFDYESHAELVIEVLNESI
jgi:hypothetical protein